LLPGGWAPDKIWRFPKVLKDDLIHAGAKWADEPVVMDGNPISSRSPADLPYYRKKFLEVLFM